MAPCHSGVDPAPVRLDLICENCSKDEATTLLYYEKSHQESGRISLINPSLICDKCKKLYLNIDDTFENIPRLIPFEVLANWDNRNYGILSKKGYEFNAFARNSYFRKKIWRIKYIWKNGKDYALQRSKEKKKVS